MPAAPVDRDNARGKVGGAFPVRCSRRRSPGFISHTKNEKCPGWGKGPYLSTEGLQRADLRAAGDCGALHRVCLGLVLFGQADQSGRPPLVGLGARESMALLGFVAEILGTWRHFKGRAPQRMSLKHRTRLLVPSGGTAFRRARQTKPSRSTRSPAQGGTDSPQFLAARRTWPAEPPRKPSVAGLCT